MLLASALLGACAALAVAASRPGEDGLRSAAEARRALLGGTGLGRAADLSRCEGAFDPRLCGSCGMRWGPVPGAGPLCPDHALAVPAEAR